MSTMNCPQCGWPSKGNGCEHCRGLTAPDTPRPVAKAIAELDALLVKCGLPKPAAMLQAKVTAALQEYLATVGPDGETTLEVISIHAGDEYAISRFSIETHIDESIIRRLS